MALVASPGWRGVPNFSEKGELTHPIGSMLWLGIREMKAGERGFHT